LFNTVEVYNKGTKYPTREGYKDNTNIQTFSNLAESTFVICIGPLHPKDYLPINLFASVNQFVPERKKLLQAIKAHYPYKRGSTGNFMSTRIIPPTDLEFLETYRRELTDSSAWGHGERTKIKLGRMKKYLHKKAVEYGWIKTQNILDNIYTGGFY